MNIDEYRKMYEIEGQYWWFIGRRNLVNWLLREHGVNSKEHLLLDVGCGTGLNLVSFSEQCRVIGSDPSLTAISFCRERSIENVFSCDARAISLATDSVDVVTALDVLEHIREDMRALEEINRVLKPGGKLIAVVPAYGFLWSEHDEALHHYRRYVAREMRAKLVASGFEIERSTYFISTLFFPILFFRLWQGLRRTSIHATVSYRMLPPWLNNLLVRLLNLERRVLRHINLPFGVSLVMVARKPAHAEREPLPR